jgi:hypothetical protein
MLSLVLIYCPPRNPKRLKSRANRLTIVPIGALAPNRRRIIDASWPTDTRNETPPCSIASLSSTAPTTAELCEIAKAAFKRPVTKAPEARRRPKQNSDRPIVRVC